MRLREGGCHSGCILEAVTDGNAFDCGKFRKAMRVAGSDVVKLQATFETLPQTIKRPKHQRGVLELVEPAREDNAKWCNVRRERSWLEDIGVDPGPQRIDLVPLAR